MASPEPNGSAFNTLQQAAEWFAILQNAPSPAEREAWRLWLHSRPEHAAAWARVEAISRPFHTLPDEACRQAAGVALRTSLTRRQHLKMLALLCGSGALSYAGLRQAPWNVWGATLRTGVGEMREERLADASRVWLNTDTALDVDFAGAQRRLTLHRGELLVELAADPRPLLLQSPQGAVNATTARFSLRLDPDIVAHALPGVLVDQDRPAEHLRVRFQMRGEVHRVADARVGHPLLRAREPGDHRP